MRQFFIQRWYHNGWASKMFRVSNLFSLVLIFRRKKIILKFGSQWDLCVKLIVTSF